MQWTSIWGCDCRKVFWWQVFILAIRNVLQYSRKEKETQTNIQTCNPLPTWLQTKYWNRKKLTHQICFKYKKSTFSKSKPQPRINNIFNNSILNYLSTVGNVNVKFRDGSEWTSGIAGESAITEALKINSHSDPVTNQLDPRSYITPYMTDTSGNSPTICTPEEECPSAFENIIVCNLFEFYNI